MNKALKSSVNTLSLRTKPLAIKVIMPCSVFSVDEEPYKVIKVVKNKT